MSKYFKRFRIDEDVFAAAFFIQLGGKAQDAADWFSKMTKGESHTLRKINRGGLFCDNDQWKGGLVWIEDPTDIPALVHECLHAVHYTFRSMRIELSEGSEEVFCYYHQWLVNSILKKAKLKIVKVK